MAGVMLIKTAILILIFSIIRDYLSRHLDSSVLNVSPAVPDVKSNFLRSFDFSEHKT